MWIIEVAAGALLIVLALWILDTLGVITIATILSARARQQPRPRK